MRNIPKSDKTIWLSSPTMHGEELKYITEAYESNWISTVGGNIDEIESLVCKHTGSNYAVSVSSGTAALHLSVRLAGVEPGDKVFCSDLTFSASANSIVYEGGIPIFIDSEYETWNMDPWALEKAFDLYPEVKAVMVTDLYGTPANYDNICAICNAHDAVLIEDAAESLGATCQGKQAGTFGAYSAVSFNGNKIITGSSGGMLLTNNIEAFNKAKKWADQSKEKAPWYQHEELGYNLRMSNVIAGIIRGQFPYLNEHIVRKKEIYNRYREGLMNLPVAMNPYLNNEKPNFWLSCILIDKDAMCEQIRTENSMLRIHKNKRGTSCPDEIYQILMKHNIQARPVWKPMHLQPMYRSNPFVSACESENDAGSDIFNRGLCLPSDIKMTRDEQNTIIELLYNCFQ